MTDLAFNLIMDCGQAMLANGGEVFRAQDTMEIMARSFGIVDFHVYVLTNGIFASAQNGTVSAVRHVPAVSTNLGHVEAINAISRRVADGELDLNSAQLEFERMKRMPTLSPLYNCAAGTMGAGCFAMLFGGGLPEMLVGALGGSSERTGFRYVALIVSGIFVVTEIICCANVKENAPTEMKTATVKEMFSALFRNDQAMVVVATIVLINSALYLTSNFIIYFFKYDFGGEGWKGSYTLFSTVGGAAQILGMMVLYPLLRKKLSSTGVFRLSLIAALAGYGLLLVFCLTGLSGNLVALLVPGIVVFACNGMLSVLTTLFLSNSVDYGQLKTGRREESVIFSMQTFVVKAASGVAVFLTGIGLDLIGLVGNTDETAPAAVQSAGTLMGLRLLMTVLPMLVLAAALVLFRKKFILTDEKAAQISAQLQEKRHG